MIRAHTVEQVRAAEAALMAELPEGALMERAAHGLATAVIDLLGSAYGRRVLLLVGSGDNGGDALYAGARSRAGARTSRRGRWASASTRAGGRRSTRAGGRWCEGPDAAAGGRGRRDRRDRRATGAEARGAGGAELLSGVPLVAVDTPSGVDVDTGEIAGAARRGRR